VIFTYHLDSRNVAFVFLKMDLAYITFVYVCGVADEADQGARARQCRNSLEVAAAALAAAWHTFRGH